MNGIGKTLMLFGFLLVAVGAVIAFLEKGVPFFGRLPGDFVFSRRNITVFFPFASMLFVSLLLTVVLNVIGRWMK